LSHKVEHVQENGQHYFHLHSLLLQNRFLTDE
jgi:hypothetical protein